MLDQPYLLGKAVDMGGGEPGGHLEKLVGQREAAQGAVEEDGSRGLAHHAKTKHRLVARLNCRENTSKMSCKKQL